MWHIYHLDRVVTAMEAPTFPSRRRDVRCRLPSPEQAATADVFAHCGGVTCSNVTTHLLDMTEAAETTAVALVEVGVGEATT